MNYMPLPKAGGSLGVNVNMVSPNRNSTSCQGQMPISNSHRKMFGRLIGFPHPDGTEHRLPWPVRVSIAAGLQQQITHPDKSIASKANLELAISYYLGFGVDRDVDK